LLVIEHLRGKSYGIVPLIPYDMMNTAAPRGHPGSGSMTKKMTCPLCLGGALKRGFIEYITIFMIRVNVQVHTRFSRACSPDEVMSIRKKTGR